MPVASDLLARGIAYVDGVPASMRSSLLIDLSQGKPTEVEALQGAVVRRAAAPRRAVPVMTTLYAVLRASVQDRHSDSKVRRSPGVITNPSGPRMSRTTTPIRTTLTMRRVARMSASGSPSSSTRSASLPTSIEPARLGDPEQVGRVGRRRLQRLRRGQAGSDVQLELAVQARARHDELLRRVGAGGHTAAELDVELHEPLKDRQRPRELRERRRASIARGS